MPTYRANGLDISSATLRLPHQGSWHGDVQVASEDLLPTGTFVELDLDGVSFGCTVLRSGRDGGKSLAKVVGGRNGLIKVLDARNYPRGPTVRGIIEDILRDAGEVLASDADETILSRILSKWERTQGPASRALTALTAKVGAIWRVKGDGTIWIGLETFPLGTVEHRLVEENWVAGLMKIAPDKADLTPGVTFLDIEIRYVVHRLRGGSLRTDAYLQSPGGLLDRALAGIRRQVDMSRLYPARVSKNNGDGTLQVVPDDGVIRGLGLDRVPVRGMPQYDPDPGDRVRIGFDAGDPARPFAVSPDYRGTAPTARQGDMVACGGPGVAVVFAGATPMVPGTPYTMTFFKAGVDPTGAIPDLYLRGVITSGKRKSLT